MLMKLDGQIWLLFVTDFEPIELSNKTYRTVATNIATEPNKQANRQIWLRDTSPDSHTHTFSPAMKARNITMRDFDVEVQPQRVALEQGELVIKWPDGILSKFSSEWLRVRNPSDEEMRRRRRHVYFEDTRMWNAREIDSRLGRYKFKDVINDDLVLHDFLWSVCLDGIAILSEGPPDAVAQMGRRIGLIHRTHFGEIFEVSTKTDASNMAYASNKELPFHIDFTSLSDPPQLQMLHMIQRTDEGGLNLFADGFYVAEQLRIHHRKKFEILNRVKIEYIEQGYDTHEGSDSRLHTFHYNMAARHIVIRTDDNDKVIRIQFGNAMRSWFYECDADQIHDVCRAMKLFTDYCYRPENILRIQLQNADTVLWANTRLLHARAHSVCQWARLGVFLGAISRGISSSLEYVNFVTNSTIHLTSLLRDYFGMTSEKRRD